MADRRYPSNDQEKTRDMYGQVSNTSLSRGFYGQDYDTNRRSDRNIFGTGPEAHRAVDHSGKGPKGYKRSDSRIREDVCERLADDELIDATDIEVRVEDGLITLSGTVDSRRIKREAEDIIEDLIGVKGVRNFLEVDPNRSKIQGNRRPSELP